MRRDRGKRIWGRGEVGERERLEEGREGKLHSGYLYIFVIYEIYIYERIKCMHYVI